METYSKIPKFALVTQNSSDPGLGIQCINPQSRDTIPLGYARCAAKLIVLWSTVMVSPFQVRLPSLKKYLAPQ
jgi:hypothetical protein